MSVKSPVNKATSNSSRMSEQLTDSNILCSRKTYGKKKEYRNLSISNENGESFSVTVSEQLKNNCTSLLSNYSEKLYTEKNFESVTTTIMNSHRGNSNIQTGAVGKSEISLFNDEDIDYYFPDSIDSLREHDSFSSTAKVSNSSSKYQRTRKNLKNRLRNPSDSSELTSHEENSSSVNNSESASNFLHLTQALPINSNSLFSVANQVEHTKNGIKATSACVKNLPSDPIPFQTSNKAEKLPGIGSMFQNSSISSSSILDLVRKFAASSNQAPQKQSSSNKRKRTQKESEPVSAKKASAKHMVSSKVSSVEKKITNSAISITNHSKGANLKNDINTHFQEIQKRHNIESPSKSSKHYLSPKKVNKASVDSIKRKTPSKTVQKRVNRSDNSNEKSIQMLQKYVNNNKTPKKCAISKAKCPSSSSSLASSGFHSIENGIAEKVQLNNGDKQVEKPSFVQLDGCTVQNQALATIPENNIASHCGPIMPMIIAPLPPICEENPMTPLHLWVLPSVADNVIQNNNAVSSENNRDLSIPGPSTLNNGDSSEKTGNYYLKNMCAEETTTTTTIVNRTNIGCNQQKRFFRPRTHINDGIDFHRYMANSLKTFEHTSILKCKEESSEFFSKNPSLLNITVKEFFDTPSLTDVLLDYVNGLDLNKPLDVPNPNKGYDFPEHFENENLLSVVKDFVHTAISYMIPSNASKPVLISYSRIIKAAMLKMSSREFIVIMQVFKKTDQLFKVKDVCARLSLVALFVIFDEYRNKNRKIR